MDVNHANGFKLWKMQNHSSSIQDLATVTQNKNQKCHSLNVIVAQSKNCPFGVNTMIKLKNITTTSNNNGI
jgi:hypothetical protein